VTPIRTMLAGLAVGTFLLRPVPPDTGHPMGPGPPRMGFGSQAPLVLDPGFGTYAWPVVGPVIRGFEPPPDPYGPGHRGIDIGAPFGTEMVAAQDGIVAFAGWVGGSLFISIDHDDGVRTTYSWLSGISVSKGEAVVREQPIGQTGSGDPGSATPRLHFGARVGDIYIDPMLLLEPGAVAGLIHLAPLTEGAPGSPWLGIGAARPSRPPRMSGLGRSKAPTPPPVEVPAHAVAGQAGRDGADSVGRDVGCFSRSRLGRTAELAHASGWGGTSGRCVRSR
jgi:hypothetical protein